MSQSTDDSNQVSVVPGSDRPSARWARLIASGAAVALAAGAIGFAVGRAGAPSDDRASTLADASPGTDAPPPTPVAVEVTSVETTLGPPQPPDTVGPVPVTTIVDGMSGQVGTVPPFMGVPAGPGMSAYPEPARELVAERTTDGGITMRAHLMRYGSDAVPGTIPGLDWAPAPWCFPAGDMRLSVVGDGTVNVVSLPWFLEPKDGLAVATFASGYVEARPMFGVVAQVSPDVTSVTFTTASGATDTATPSNGVALLVVPSGIEDSFEVRAERPGGPITVSSTDLAAGVASEELHEDCDPPPPPLPDPGAQPADRDAAEAAVRAAWEEVHARDADHATRLESIDDPAGIDDAWTALEAGQYAEAARTSTADIAELVFTSPTEAWFRYDVLTSMANFFDRFGMARLGDDGVWRITRQTVCQDLSLAPGFGCSPSVAPLLPPSAADDPRYQEVPVDD